MWKFSVILLLTVLGGFVRAEEETQTKNGNKTEVKKNEYNCVDETEIY